MVYSGLGMSEKIVTRSFEAPEKGVHLLVLGSIHGNEPAGTEAIEKIINQIESGKLRIRRGKVVFVSICNPRARASNVRFVEEDLNRVFRETNQPTSYEATLANQLCSLAKKCDAMLDIHTSGAPGPASIFIDFPTAENKAFADALRGDYALLDWPELYESNPHGFQSFDTTAYAYEQGKIGVLIECGQHEDPEAAGIAEKNILRTLIHFKMIDPIKGIEQINRPRKNIHMKVLGKKEHENDVFAQKWSHLQPVAAGTVIAIRASGEEIVAEKDSIVMFPKFAAKAGGEWFYLGVIED